MSLSFRWQSTPQLLEHEFQLEKPYKNDKKRAKKHGSTVSKIKLIEIKSKTKEPEMSDGLCWCATDTRCPHGISHRLSPMWEDLETVIFFLCLSLFFSQFSTGHR